MPVEECLLYTVSLFGFPEFPAGREYIFACGIVEIENNEIWKMVEEYNLGTFSHA
jgi:hypothetical protein